MERTTNLPPVTTAEATAPAPAPVRTHLGLLLMVGIWAVNFSVIKVALEHLSPLAFNALRFPLASLMVWAVLRGRGPIPLPRRGDVVKVLALGVLGNVIYQLLFIFGLDRTRAGNAALLLASTPILTALLASALGVERPRPRVWCGAIATVVGMALVVVGGASGIELGLGTMAGDLILVGASLSWSLYTVGSNDLIQRYGPVPVTAWTLWIGAIGIVLLGLPDLADLDWTAVPATGWAAVAFAGLLGIGLAYLLWYQGVRYIGNTRTAVYSNLVPVLALVVAWLWLGEVPGAWQVVGAAVIIGGVTVARR
ncbi:MAG TPA: DMT family transporter [Longimicrobiales bacterium]